MRALEVLLLVASIALTGCVDALHSQQVPAKWTTGFWFWGGGSTDTPAGSEELNTLYVHVGAILKAAGPYAKEPWAVYGALPDHLPPAQEYWLVFRFEHQAVPDLSSAPILAREVSRLREDARQRHLNLAGVQLDIDSPTGSLSKYAAYVHEVKKGLPPGLEVSVTALLDWFRSGTAIADVIKEVDEFVPQFYDVASPENGDPAIASKIDTAKWGPVFNRFGKRFRIGISTFG